MRCIKVVLHFLNEQKLDTTTVQLIYPWNHVWNFILNVILIFIKILTKCRPLKIMTTE